MTKRRSFLIVLLGLIVALCLSFAVACGGDEGEQASIKWAIEGEKEHVTVTIDDKEVDTAATLSCTVGETLEFKVTPDDHYEATVRVGRSPLNAKNGVYSHQVKSGEATITINVTKKLQGVSVTTNPTKMTYYAGEALDPAGMVVTANYETGDSEAVTTYTINYPTTSQTTFLLGDKSFTVSYGGKTSAAVNLTQTVVGKITLDPQGGKIADSYKTGLEANTEIKNVKVDASGVLTFEFEKALENAIDLPGLEQISRGEEGDYTFVSWSENNTAVLNVPAETNLSKTYTANWNAKLLTLTKVYYHLEGKVPQLIIEGSFRAATSAYLYLYEGNDKVELKGPTIPATGEAKRGDPFKLTFDMTEVIDKGYRGMWMDIKFVAEADGVKDTQEIDLDDYQDNPDFCDLNDSVHTGGYTYYFQAYQGKYLKAVADYFLDVDIEIAGSEKDGKLTLTVSGTVKDEEFRGKVLSIDWWINGSVQGLSPIAADGKFSIDFNVEDWSLNTNCYAHIYVIESESDTTRLFPKGLSGDFNLPIGWIKTELSDNGHLGEIDGDSIVISKADYSKVFYVGKGTNGGLIAYGRNEKSSIELADYDVALKVDNFQTPTKVYYVVRVKLGGRTPYTKQELVDRLLFGNVDSTNDTYRLESLNMVKDVEGSEGVYDLWYNITSYSGGQLWPNLYLVANAEAEATKSDRIFEIKDADHSTDGLFAIVGGKKYTIHSATGAPYYDAPCIVLETPAETDKNPEYVDPDYVPPQKSFTVDMSTLKLELVGGKPTLTIKGDVTGYAQDEITFDLQTNGNGVHSQGGWQYVYPATTVTIANGKFTVTVDLSEVGLHETANNNGLTQYIMHLKFGTTNFDIEYHPGSSTEKEEDSNKFHVEYNNLHYTIIVRKGQTWNRDVAQLAVSEEALDEPVVPKGTFTATKADLELATDKVYFVISGTSTNYNNEELTAALNAAYFDLQENGTIIGQNQWERKSNFAKTVTIGENGAWTIKYDISALTKKGYTAHFTLKNPNGAIEDANVNNLSLTDKSMDGHTAKLGAKTFTIVNKNGEEGVGDDANRFWGNVGVKVDDPRTITFGTATLVEESGKVYIVYEGTYALFTEAELRALDWLGSAQENPNAGGHATGESGSWASFKFTGTLTIDTAKSSWTYKCEVTQLEANRYTVHFSTENSESGDFSKPMKDSSVEKTVGSKTYKLVTYAENDNSGAKYWNCYGLEVTDSAAKTLTAKSAELKLEGEKPYLVLKIESAQYTVEELKTIKLFEGNKTKPAVDESKSTIVANGESTLYFDLSALTTGDSWYWTHLEINGKGFDGGNGDLKPTSSNLETKAETGTLKFSLSLNNKPQGSQLIIVIEAKS